MIPLNVLYKGGQAGDLMIPATKTPVEALVVPRVGETIKFLETNDATFWEVAEVIYGGSVLPGKMQTLDRITIVVQPKQFTLGGAR